MLTRDISVVHVMFMLDFVQFLQMPIEMADQINAIDDPMEFLHEFVDSNSLENLTTLAHPRDASRRREFDLKNDFICLLLDLNKFKI